MTQNNTPKQQETDESNSSFGGKAPVTSPYRMLQRPTPSVVICFLRLTSSTHTRVTIDSLQIQGYRSMRTTITRHAKNVNARIATRNVFICDLDSSAFESLPDRRERMGCLVSMLFSQAETLTSAV